MSKPIKKSSSIDVARLANVSQATVSRVFSNSPNISKTTKEKVLKIAKEINYKPNLLASALNTKRVNIIGIVNPTFNTAFYTQRCINSLTKYIQKNDCVSMLLSINEESNIEYVIEKALMYQIDGIIIPSITLNLSVLEECKKFNIPVLLFNRHCDDENVLSVSINNLLSGSNIANYLIEKGHRKLAYISGNIESSTDKERYNGFLDALKSQKLKIFDYYQGDFFYKSGYEAAKKMLSNKNIPDAVFSANDEMALGFIDCANIEFNIKIPDDISIIGFDNIYMSSTPRYNLTTIEEPLDYMSKIAIDVLRNATKDTNSQPISISVDGKFIERGSVLNKK